MNRRRGALYLLALSALSVGGAMAASPRDETEYYITPPPETPEEQRGRRAGEMEGALGLLVGKFGMERPWVLAIPSPPENAPRTMLDCMAIGEGKGVHCVLLTVLRPAAPAGRTDAGRQRTLRPTGLSMASSFTEYGIDPNDSRVRAMKVDRGSAVLMGGVVRGDRMTIQGPCWDRPAGCMVGVRVIASADGEDLSITEFSFTSAGWSAGAKYTLRRLTQEEAEAVSWNVEGAPPTFPTKPSRPR